MRKKHPHAELIKAWADGAEIQVEREDEWEDIANPSWTKCANYRIKPEPKTDIVRFGCFDDGVHDRDIWVRMYRVKQENLFDSTMQLKLTFDGETGKIKSAELLNA